MAVNAIAEIGFAVNNSDLARMNRHLSAANDELSDLENNNKRAANTGKKSESSFKKIGKAAGLVTVGITAAVAAYTALNEQVKQQAQAVKELTNLATVAGVTAQEMESLSVAAKSVSLTGENVADMVKDISDKLGDFINNDAGPFKDFFTNLPKDINLTASALAGMDGLERLQAIKNAMDEANYTADQQRQIMESLGSDYSKLTPLLEKNGEGFKAINQELKNNNALLTGLEIERLTEFAKQSDLFDQNFSKMANTAASALAPALGAVNGWLSGIVGWLNEPSKELQDVLALPPEQRFDATKKKLDEITTSIEKAKAETQNVYLDSGGRGSAASRLSDLREAKEELEAQLRLLERGKKIEAERAAAEKAAQAVIDKRKLKEEEIRQSKIRVLKIEKQIVDSRIEYNEAVKAGQATIDQATEASDVDLGISIIYSAEQNQIQDLYDFKRRILDEEVKDKEKHTEKLKILNAEYYEALDAAETKSAEKSTADTKKFVKNEQQRNQERLSQASSFFGNLAVLQESGSKKLGAIGKAAAVSQATIDGFAAVQKALASAPPPFNFALAAAVGVATGANIGKIIATPLAKGGVLDSPQFVGSVGGTPAIAGEAGPEAVLPLGRDSQGRLGVRGGVNVEGGVNVTINGNASSQDVEDGVFAAMNRVAIEQIGEQQRIGNISNPITMGGVL